MRKTARKGGERRRNVRKRNMELGGRKIKKKNLEGRRTTENKISRNVRKGGKCVERRRTQWKEKK